ncbi:MAG: efflux transporter outer membrane subunit [Planctomycetota bacterium]
MTYINLNALRGRIFSAIVPILLASCTTLGRDYEPPVIDVPDTWSGLESQWLAPDAPALARWWRQLDEPLLDDLIEQALTRGPDLREALARVRRARAVAGIVEGELRPALDLEASVVRRDESDSTPFGAFAPEATTHRFGLAASWEVDLWGRVRRSIEAVEADLDATLEDARAVAVLVAAETATAYVDLRAFQNRLAIARTHLALQEDSLALVRSRYEAGLVDERDVAQAATNVEATRARVPALEIGTRRAENRLAVLVGRAPGYLGQALQELRALPRAPERVAVGVPADLLRRRPDVRRAERALAAEVARIGVAQADLYPRLTLAGDLGLATTRVGDLFESDSGAWGLGPSLRWSLFDGGRLRARVEAQDARAEEAMIAWEHTVLRALEEAENSLTSYVRGHERRRSVEAGAAQARRAVGLARTQYREGLADFQVVLDSERVGAELDDQVATSDADLLADLVALYAALGGGFGEESSPGTAGASPGNG